MTSNPMPRSIRVAKVGRVRKELGLAGAQDHDLGPFFHQGFEVGRAQVCGIARLPIGEQLVPQHDQAGAEIPFPDLYPSRFVSLDDIDADGAVEGHFHVSIPALPTARARAGVVV